MPTELDPKLEAILRAGKLGLLATIRRSGRPQLSMVIYAYDPQQQTIRVSVTADRAKTRNLQRDPRATFQVQGKSPWNYVVADCDAELGPVTEQPGDAGSEALVELYRAISGEHDDWDDYRAAMVTEQRQVLTMKVTHLYGQG